ncbi:MAG TPA: zinc metallopeptidase [Bacteroidia bacterium]|nr:zinc metallopeptidase [Bacteroidia bacterium]
MYFDPILLILTIFFVILGIAVSSKLKNKFAHYSGIPTSSGLTGKEIAEKMLHDNGIYDVKVISVEGQLTDHYHPLKKTVNLSEAVFHGRNVAAAAVAAHECGHAVQHAAAYPWLGLRSVLVPVVNVSSVLMNVVLLLMAVFAVVSQLYNQALIVIIVLQSAITLFSLVTLPVEFDASRRALAWLEHARITRGAEHEGAKDALKWAAATYVVAALAAIATLLYFVFRLMGSRRD